MNRCENCKHWNRENPEALNSTKRECPVLLDLVSEYWAHAEGQRETFYTDPKFGCVLFEPTAPASP
jgi:hypothetical protein